MLVFTLILIDTTLLEILYGQAGCSVLTLLQLDIKIIPDLNYFKYRKTLIPDKNYLLDAIT